MIKYTLTGGGLLAAISQEETETCIAELVQAGYKEAAVIGKIEESVDHHAKSDKPEALISII